MRSDIENLRRDEREARRLGGETAIPRRIKKKRIKIKTNEDLEALAKETYETGPQRLYDRVSGVGGENWYIFGVTLGGQKTVYGPKHSEAEALEAGRKLDNIETYKLKTINLAAATQVIKGKHLSKGEDPDAVLKNVKHTEEHKSHSVFRRR